MAFAAIYFAVHRLDPKSKFAPALSSILLSLTLLSLGLADTAQTESYSLVLIIFAGLLMARAGSIEKFGVDRFAVRAIFAGAFIGFATFFKTTNVIFLLPIALEVFLLRKKQSLRPIVFLSIGFILSCLLEIGFLATQGSHGEYLRIAGSVFSNHSTEVSSFSIGDIPRAIWIYVDIWGILSAVAIFAGLVKRDADFIRTIRYPLFALVAGIVAVIFQNKGWGYQYVVILPGLIPLIALSAVYLYQILRDKNRKWLAITVVTIVAISTIFATPSARRRIHYISDAIKSINDHPAYIATLGSLRSLYYPAGTEKLARYIESHSDKNDNIFIFGEEPGAYWLSDRMPASKYIYSLLFTSGVIPDKDLLAINDTIARKRPLLIIIERFDTLNFRGRPETSESLVASDPVFASMKEMLARDYAKADTVCEKFIVYRRRTVAP